MELGASAHREQAIGSRNPLGDQLFEAYQLVTGLFVGAAVVLVAQSLELGFQRMENGMVVVHGRDQSGCGLAGAGEAAGDASGVHPKS